MSELREAGAICVNRKYLTGGGAGTVLDEGNTFSVGRPSGVSRVISVACLQEKWIYSAYADYVHLPTGLTWITVF
jgi:ABC-type glucose/galactose transport system permease subunit